MEELLEEAGWERWHDWHGQVMAPIVNWFCDRAEPGQRVLDAACGTGLPALALAARVQPGGAVIAVEMASLNPFFTTLFGTMARFMSGPPPDPKGPGPFRLSAPGELARLLAEAGFTDVNVEQRELTWVFESVGDHFGRVKDLASPVARAARTLPPAELDRLQSALAESLAPYLDGGRVRLPGVALCASARR